MKVRLHWTTYISEERSATFVLEDLPEVIRAKIEGIIELDDGDIPLGVVDMEVLDIAGVVSELTTPHEEEEARIVSLDDRRIHGVELLPEVPSRPAPSIRMDDDPVGDLEERAEHLRDRGAVSGEW